MSLKFINQALIVGLFSAAIRMATPLALAALGEIFSENSGIINLGVEGIMLMGALLGFLGTYFTGSLLVGVLLSILIGIIMALIHGLITIRFMANQVVSGMALWLLGWGLSGFLYRMIFGVRTLPPTVKGFDTISIPLLSEMPFLGAILFNHNVLVYLMFILVFLSSIVLYRTDFGLRIRAVGENPKAADTLGVDVYRIRYMCLMIEGGLAGLAGAYLSLAQLSMFIEGMTLGKGFIAIAIVYFGKWNPYRTFSGALLFGFVDALQKRLQTMGFGIPYQFLLMLPYIITILTLLGVARKAEAPASLGVPYRRE